jgi:hypothetical protein
MMADPKPATPLPWTDVEALVIEDDPYLLLAANNFPHLLWALERIALIQFKADCRGACRMRDIAERALAIARGEAVP